MVKEIKSRFGIELGVFCACGGSSKETCQQARKQLEKTVKSKWSCGGRWDSDPAESMPC
jgi:hypothetical protein